MVQYYKVVVINKKNALETVSGKIITEYDSSYKYLINKARQTGQAIRLPLDIKNKSLASVVNMEFFEKAKLGE